MRSPLALGLAPCRAKRRRGWVIWLAKTLDWTCNDINHACTCILFKSWLKINKSYTLFDV